MPNPFAGVLTGGSQAAPAAPVSASPAPANAFAGLLTGKAPTIAPSAAPIAPASPVSRPSANPQAPAAPSIPATALKGPLGGGYGPSNITDPASGKPLLTYENPQAKASQLLSDRTAPTFDPTVPQKVDPKTLQDPRMAESVSQAIKNAVGGTAFSELDHIMPLELGGSNNKTNLRLEPGSNPTQKYSSNNPTPTDPLENQLADQVHSGNISLVEAWQTMARAKGVTLPEDGGPVPNLGKPGIQPNTEPDEQPKPNLFDGLLTGKTTNGQPTLLAKAGNYIKDAFTNPGATSKSLFNALGGNAVVHPIQTLNTIVNNAKQGTDATLQNLASSAKNVVSGNQSASQRTASVLNFLTSAASTLFTPVSETFNIASQLPVIKPAADLTGLIFNKTGQVGGFAADKLLSVLPISSTAKANLATAVHNVGTLAGQVILGGHIYGAITGAMDANGEITSEQEQKIVADANDKAQQINKASMPETPKAPAPAVAEKTGAEPLQTPEKTPEVKPIEGTGETKTSALAQGVEEKAVEAKLTRGFSDLPEYKTVNMKDQAAKAVDIVSSNYDQAKRIAMGQEAPPEGVLPESVFVAVENKALQDNDVSTLRDLATQSSLTTEATTMGQRIRTLAERDDASPTEAIKGIQTAREQAAAVKLKGGDLETEKGKIAEDIKGEIKKAAPKITDWKSFVDSIKC